MDKPGNRLCVRDPPPRDRRHKSEPLTNARMNRDCRQIGLGYRRYREPCHCATLAFTAADTSIHPPCSQLLVYLPDCRVLNDRNARDLTASSRTILRSHNLLLHIFQSRRPSLHLHPHLHRSHPHPRSCRLSPQNAQIARHIASLQLVMTPWENPLASCRELAPHNGRQQSRRPHKLQYVLPIVAGPMPLYRHLPKQDWRAHPPRERWTVQDCNSYASGV